MDIVALYVKVRARLMRHSTGAADAVLIGGSSTEYWRTSAQDLQPLSSRNYGIGGSTAAQWVQFAPVLVQPCAPKNVFIYAGANDLHIYKESPEAVFAHLKQLFTVLMQQLPDANLYYAGVYLTDRYRGQWEDDRACNRLVQEYAKTCPALTYIDIPAALADEQGVPLRGIFRKDGEHLNAHGYALWRAAVLPYLAGERGV